MGEGSGRKGQRGGGGARHWQRGRGERSRDWERRRGRGERGGAGEGCQETAGEEVFLWLSVRYGFGAIPVSRSDTWLVTSAWAFAFGLSVSFLLRTVSLVIIFFTTWCNVKMQNTK